MPGQRDLDFRERSVLCWRGMARLDTSFTLKRRSGRQRDELMVPEGEHVGGADVDANPAADAA